MSIVKYVSHCRLCSKIHITLIWFSEQVNLNLSFVLTSILKLRIIRCLLEWGSRWDSRVMKLLKESNFVFILHTWMFHWLGSWGDTSDKCSWVIGLVGQLLVWGACQHLHGQILTGDRWRCLWFFWFYGQNLILICSWNWIICRYTSVTVVLSCSLTYFERSQSICAPLTGPMGWALCYSPSR